MQSGQRPQWTNPCRPRLSLNCPKLLEAFKGASEMTGWRNLAANQKMVAKKSWDNQSQKAASRRTAWSGMPPPCRAPEPALRGALPDPWCPWDFWGSTRRPEIQIIQSQSKLFLMENATKTRGRREWHSAGWSPPKSVTGLYLLWPLRWLSKII